MTTKFSQFSAGGEVRQDDIIVGLRSGVNTKFDFPGDGIKDEFGNYIVKWTTTGVLGTPAINFVEFKNAASGLNPKVITGTTGSDVSVGLEVETFGNGNIILNPAGTGYVSIPGTNAVFIPSGTTGQQPVGATGGLRHNSTTTYLEYWNGASWVSVISGAGTVTSVSGTANRITSTGGATPVIDISAAYVGQTSLTTLGTITTGIWNASVIALAYGGTNANLTASNGGIFYSTATAGAILSGTATAGQMLRSGATAAPTWSTATFPATATGTGTILRADGTNWVATTATYPATTTINQLLYSSSNNVIGGLSTVNSAVLVTGATGVPVFSSTMTNGQVIIGSTGATPVAASLTAGSGVTITPGAGTITIAATGSGGTVTSVTATLPLLSSGGNTPDISMQGLTTLAQGDIIYASAAATFSRLAKDTNATRYLSNTGASNNPAWAQIDLSNGITGVVPLANGGTNANLTASNGGIFYSTATAGAILSGTATAGKVLQSGATAAPTWSTPTYPSASGTAGQIIRSDGTNNVYSTSTFADTYAVSTLLYASSSNVVSGLATTNRAALSTNSTGVPTWLALTDGQLVIGSSAGSPAAGSLTAGTGVQVTNASNSITVASTATSINTQTASYGLVLADAGKIVEMNVGSANNLTVPLNATQAFSIGTIIDILQFGAGKTTVVATGGVTIESVGGLLSLAAQYAGATLYKRGTDDWVLVGNLIA